jgi:hypothetical protein
LEYHLDFVCRHTNAGFSIHVIISRVYHLICCHSFGGMLYFKQVCHAQANGSLRCWQGRLPPTDSPVRPCRTKIQKFANMLKIGRRPFKILMP